MTLDELVTIIRYKTDESSAKKAEVTAEKVAGSIGRSFKSAFGMMAGVILPAAGIGGIAMIGYKAITTTANLEKLTAQYEVMLGSVGRANKMIKDVQELAKSTPLTSMGISETVKQLIAFGIKGENAIDVVRTLGDVAGGDQERLNRLAYAYGQTMTAGKLMGQDLMQYMNQGFNPLKVMAENAEKFGLKAGVTMSELRDQMSKGLISSQMVAQAFRMATEEGGLFYQNMQKQSQTLGGLWSTFVDEIEMAMIEVVTPFMDDLKDGVRWMIKFAQGAGQMAVAIKDLMMTLYEFKGILLLIPPILTMIYGQQVLSKITSFLNIQKLLTREVNVYGKTIQVANTKKQMMLGAMGQIQTSGANMWRSLVAGAKSFVGVTALAQIAMLGLLYLQQRQQKHEEQTANINEVKESKAEFRIQRGKLKEMRANLDETNGYEWQQSQMAWVKLSDEEMKVRKRAIKDQEYAVEDAQARWESSVAMADPKAYDKIKKAQERREKEKMDAEVERTKAEMEKTNAEMEKLTKSQTTNVTNNVSNKINIPLTVDDKGQTQLSQMALDEALKTAIRSAFSIELIGLTEGI